MNKKIIIIIGVIIVGLIIILFSVRFLSPEDNWICENGKWQKHGNPSSVMPSIECKK